MPSGTLGGFIFETIRHVLCSVRIRLRGRGPRSWFGSSTIRHYAKSRRRFEGTGPTVHETSSGIDLQASVHRAGVFVGSDYHVSSRATSVPHGFARQTVEAHASGSLLGFYREGVRMASTRSSSREMERSLHQSLFICRHCTAIGLDKGLPITKARHRHGRVRGGVPSKVIHRKRPTIRAGGAVMRPSPPHLGKRWAQLAWKMRAASR